MASFWEDLDHLFSAGSLTKLRDFLLDANASTTESSATLIPEFVTQADCVRYADDGIEFQPGGLSVSEPKPDEVMILPVAVSLCGTDVALIDKARAGNLSPESNGKVVGHEASGFVVGIGKDVAEAGEWRIGDMVCLDSHFACQNAEHASFDDCVASGASCDGIVGGIRGALKPNGDRDETHDGYWSRVFTVPVSALPIKLPLDVANHLAAPSTIESLGNIYMMVEQMESVGLLENPSESLVVVSGLGATGYPMAAVAKHYGFDVVGVNPSEGKRSFALDQKVVDSAYQDLSMLKSHVPGKKNVIVIVTAGVEQAHQEALDWLESLTEETGIERRAAIIFGLFSDAEKPLPYCPADLLTKQGQPLPQRDFVFSRKSFETKSRTEVYGVCGRDLRSWQMLMTDLAPNDQGQPPRLVEQLNAAIHVLHGDNSLQEIAEILNQGSDSVKSFLKESGKLKLAACFIK